MPSQHHCGHGVQRWLALTGVHLRSVDADNPHAERRAVAGCNVHGVAVHDTGHRVGDRHGGSRRRRSRDRRRALASDTVAVSVERLPPTGVTGTDRSRTVRPHVVTVGVVDARRSRRGCRRRWRRRTGIVDRCIVGAVILRLTTVGAVAVQRIITRTCQAVADQGQTDIGAIDLHEAQETPVLVSGRAIGSHRQCNFSPEHEVDHRLNGQVGGAPSTDLWRVDTEDSHGEHLTVRGRDLHGVAIRHIRHDVDHGRRWRNRRRWRNGRRHSRRHGSRRRR